jgi:hypothetical protein
VTQLKCKRYDDYLLLAALNQRIAQMEQGLETARREPKPAWYYEARREARALHSLHWLL